MFVEVNGARIFFDTVGPHLAVDREQMRERRSLVIMHGGPGFDHSLMRPWFDRFADTFQVVYLDHRGNGRSGGDPDSWRLDQWGDDIRAFCDVLGLERPIVYGLSFGGMVAMSYASRHPDHPSRLVLASTAAKMELAATFEMMERLGGAQARSCAERFWSEPSESAAADYMKICMPLYNPTVNPDADTVRARARQRFEVMFHFINGEQRTMDLLAGLAHVRCPTLVQAGGLDPITPLVCSQAIFAALPKEVAQLEVFESAGHGVHRDEPARAEESLRRFFGDGEASPSRTLVQSRA
jgi:pimeloyl-ACP methyl ester carboxylesterase